MHANIHTANRPRPAWGAMSTINTSPSHRPQVQVPLKSSVNSSTCSGPHRIQSAFLATPPTSSPAPQHDTEADQQPTVYDVGPAQYTLDDGPRAEPGTAAYYKSWAFRQKVKEGTAIVPEQENDASESHDDSADEDYVKKRREPDSRESLIMIFSRTSVRRAKTQRKVNKRMQQANRRTKFKRKLEKTKPLFEWD